MSMDAAGSEIEKRDMMKDLYPGMNDKLHKEEMHYETESSRTAYLKLYYLVQFVGHACVLAIMAVRYDTLEHDSFADTYEHVGPAIQFLQVLQCFELIPGLIGYTKLKGGALVPLVQVSGRLFLTFVMIAAVPHMHTKSMVFYLFVIWSIIEVVRYPYYLSQLYKKEIYILTWLRYTMWLPLYPIGIICEAIVILRNIPYFEETQKFSVGLPNEWNFTFHMATFLRFYLLFFTFPSMVFLMSYMFKLRAEKLNAQNNYEKSK